MYVIVLSQRIGRDGVVTETHDAYAGGHHGANVETRLIPGIEAAQEDSAAATPTLRIRRHGAIYDQVPASEPNPAATSAARRSPVPPSESPSGPVCFQRGGRVNVQKPDGNNLQCAAAAAARLSRSNKKP